MALNSPKTFLGCKIAVKPFMNSRMFSQSIGMRTLCVFVFCLAFALIDAAAKQRHCTFRVHAQANPRDTDVFSISTAFSPYPAKDGTFGALFQLDEHGGVVLDTLSIERRGRFLFVFINGRMITELRIDKRVSDGKIYVPSGLTAADVELMKKQWRLLGERKR